MKLPKDAIIPIEKITQYLLVLKARNDKSKFLARAGFTLDNPEALVAAIRTLIQSNQAVEDIRNEYGVFYRVSGNLVGVNNISLPVVTIWLQREVNGKFQFITLKPLKES